MINKDEVFRERLGSWEQPWSIRGRDIEMDVWHSVLQALAKGFCQTLLGVSEVAQQVNVNVPGT